jgi:hypothetical protein
MATEKTSAALDATDPDLKDFASRGGKLIIYHGWNDPAISPLSTIDYYRKVKSKNRRLKCGLVRAAFYGFADWVAFR